MSVETPFPAVDQVTPEWLTAVLRVHGHLDRGRVVGVRLRGGASAAGGGPGFRPDHRLEVSCSGDAPSGAPRKLYLKAEDGAVDGLGGKKEIAFYRDVAPSMVQSPGLPCYGAAHDAESGAYYLLLKDASDTHLTVEREAPAPRRDMEMALDLLASLHAFWRGRLQPAGEIGLVDSALIDGQDTYDFGGYVDYLGDRLSTERRHIYERVLAALPELLKRRFCEGEGLTLVHDDAHIWNFLLPCDPEQDRVYLVDWEQWGASVGPHDVAYMIGLFWYPERRARMEKGLVRHYYERLPEHGVAHYSWHACWYDYRLFAIRNLMVPLWAWTWARRGGWRWGFHRWMQLEKAMSAFQDLGCAELLAD
jgi:hypothetical protein